MIKLKNYTLYVVTKEKCVKVKTNNNNSKILKLGISFFHRKNGEIILEIDEKAKFPMKLSTIQYKNENDFQVLYLDGVKELF